MRKTTLVLWVILLLLLTACRSDPIDNGNGDTDPIDNGNDDTEPGDVLNVDFSIHVSFGSIRIMIDEILDQDENTLSFDELYELLNTNHSGLSFYTEDGSAAEIFISFEAMENEPLIEFDNTAGTINILGEIELNTGAFAPGSILEDFEVFVHDLASIRVKDNDDQFDETRSVIIPYLSLTSTQSNDNLQLSLDVNDAYGDNPLAFLPEFLLTGDYSVNLLETVGKDYSDSKSNRLAIADFNDENIYAWIVFVDEYSQNIDSLSGVSLTFSDGSFILSANKTDLELQAAFTLYIMDGSIGTIQYMQVRLLGDKDSSNVLVSAIEGSGNETKVISNYYTVESDSSSFDFSDNSIESSDILVTNDTLVGLFLDRLEKENPLQTYKVTTLNNRPLSPSVFGPAIAKDPNTDYLENGDILSVLSSDWTTIRYYQIIVVDVIDAMDAVNDANDENELITALKNNVFNFSIDQNYKIYYWEAFQAVSDHEGLTFENYESLRLWLIEVNDDIQVIKTMFLDLNDAENAEDLLTALQELDDIENINIDYQEAYWQAYSSLDLDESPFIALEQAQAFVDGVNQKMLEQQLLLDNVNDAQNEDELYIALSNITALNNLITDNKTLYWEAYQDLEAIFDAIEGVQAFVDSVNLFAEELAAMLLLVNQAESRNDLFTALSNPDLDLSNLIAENDLDYWEAYQHAGYDNGESFNFVEEVQGFIDTVNQEVAARLELLLDVNSANSKESLLAALQDSKLELDNVVADYAEAYWTAYTEEGYDNDKAFRYIEAVQGFVNGVNDLIDDQPNGDADLSAVNNASNANELIAALLELPLDNVIEGNAQAYWNAYQHGGFNNGNTFDHLQAVQAFVNQVNP